MQLEPERAEFYLARGVSHYDMDERVAALADFDRALELEPTMVEALVYRGVVHLAARRLDFALTDFGGWEWMMSIRYLGLMISSLLVLTLAACTISTVSIVITPASVTLAPGTTQSFAVTVTGSSDTEVIWKADCGSLSGGGGTVLFSAPIPFDGVCTVTATLVADSGKRARARVRIDPAVPIWVQQLGTGATDRASGVVVDAGGNIYIAGRTGGDLGGANAGGRDLFVAKFDGDGNSVWVRQLGSGGDEVVAGVAVDSSGDVFVAGSTSGVLAGAGNAGGRDLFVAKFGGDGNSVWVRQLGSGGDEVVAGVAVDGSGDVFVTGSTSGVLEGTANAGGQDLFLAKFGGDGVEKWVRQLGTGEVDMAEGVAVDGGGNAYVTGGTWGDLAGGGNFGVQDLFLIKFGGGGIKKWVRQLGTSLLEVAFGVAVDGSGNIFVSGWTEGNLAGNGNAGSSDLFLAKFGGGGIKKWVRQLGTSTLDVALGVTVDGSGNALVCGWTFGGLDGNFGFGGQDLFLAKFDAGGKKLSVRQLGTSASDVAMGVAVDGSGNAYLAGWSEGGLAGNGSAGGEDLLLVKYSP